MIRSIRLVPALFAAGALAACEHALSEPGDYEAGAGVEAEDVVDVPGSPYGLVYAGEDPPAEARGLPVAERLVEGEAGPLD